jgi:hypothetical protein
VSYLGGPSAASIAFLDIHNIHVMRDSLLRLREESSVNNLGASGRPAGLGSGGGGGGAGGGGSGASGGAHLEKTFGCGGSAGDAVDGLHHSRWLHHVSTVLRAAVTTADSLLLRHPVLVHCRWGRYALLCYAYAAYAAYDGMGWDGMCWDVLCYAVLYCAVLYYIVLY